MTQDLTKNTTPFGMLDAETQNALKAAFLDGKISRVKPEPVTASMWCVVYPWGVGCSYSSRKMADRGASTRRLAVLRLDITDGEVSAHIEEA